MGSLIFSGLAILLVLILCIFSLICQIYGIVLGFKKKWYVGLAAIVVPMFAIAVGGAKLLGKKDLL